MRRTENNKGHNNERGMALISVLIFLASFSILGFLIVARFSNTGAADQFLRARMLNEKFGLLNAGYERARYHLLRPDDVTKAHRWTAGGAPETLTLTINGEEVTVTIEDIVWDEE